MEQKSVQDIIPERAKINMILALEALSGQWHKEVEPSVWQSYSGGDD